MYRVLGCAPTPTAAARPGWTLEEADLDEADLDYDADLENADLEDFGDLDADDADLQATLTVLAVLADDISDVEGADELAGDEDVPDGQDGAGEPDESEPGQPSAEADGEAEGPAAAGARMAKLPPGGGGEDEEIFVFGDDDDIFRPRRSRWRALPRIRSRIT